MTATDALLLAAVIWITLGSIAAVAMARRGHNPFQWWVIGVALGPAAIVLAIVETRREGFKPLDQRVTPGASGSGQVDVVVGIDGSPGSDAAVRAAAELFRADLARLTLAAVVDFESAKEPGRRDEEREAREHLAHAADLVANATPATVLLTGRPDEALLGFAAEHGAKVVVIGARGKGMSRRVLGSVAERLTGHPAVAVLVVPAPE